MLVTALPARAAITGPGEGDLTARINGERSSRGLSSYASRSDLVYVARRHASRMAAQRRIFHNPSLGSEVSGWRSIGENVGRGSDARSVHNAFMSSSAHRANILDTSFREVGVGTAAGGDGLIYVVEVFRQPTRSAAASPAPAPAPTASRATRVPARSTPRASRSTRRPVIAGPVVTRPRVHPGLLLRARFNKAVSFNRRKRVDSVLPDLVVYHWTVRLLAG